MTSFLELDGQEGPTLTMDGFDTLEGILFDQDKISTEQFQAELNLFPSSLTISGETDELQQQPQLQPLQPQRPQQSLQPQQLQLQARPQAHIQPRPQAQMEPQPQLQSIEPLNYPDSILPQQVYSSPESSCPSSPQSGSSSPEHPSFSPDHSPSFMPLRFNEPKMQNMGFPFQTPYGFAPGTFPPVKIKEERKEEEFVVNIKKRPFQQQLLLSRDELLRISSEHYEQIVQFITSERPLTVEEERLYKRQKRLIKNRESAQLSRNRKKSYLGDLEQKVAELVAQNEALTNENKALKNENTQLKALLKKTQPPPNKSGPGMDKKVVTLLGIFFFAFLFGFGPSLYKNGDHHFPPLPSVHDTRESFLVRVLHSVDDDKQDSFPTPSTNASDSSPEPQSRMNTGVLAKYVTYKSLEPKPKSPAVPKEDQQKKSKVKIHVDEDSGSVVEAQPAQPVAALPSKDSESQSLVPVQSNPQLAGHIFGGQWVKPNLYMYCPKYDIISGPDFNINTTTHHKGSPRIFSFVVPANMFHLSGAPSNSNHFVEINTQILGIFPITNQNQTVA